jgi:hypothetical protein
MTRSPAHIPPPAHSPAPAWHWYATAGTLALAALVLLALHTNRLITTAGLLAAAGAATALATGWLRTRRASSADLIANIGVSLILATPLLVLLGIIKATQHSP